MVAHPDHDAALQSNLSGPLALPVPAVDWLMDMWHLIHFFDDVADGDKVERPDLDRAIYAALMPVNPFGRENAPVLLPIVGLQLMKWQGADTAERAGKASERSYMWRAGFYDLVLAVVGLVHGPGVAVSAAAAVMEMYGETFAEYAEEFKCPSPS